MDLMKDLDFIVELEKMKSIYRRTMIIGTDRRENDAEHSWHIATMAMVLEKYNKADVDLSRVIQMLLIHDIVEIYAGDTFAYDKVANGDKRQREEAAMEKIKSQLSSSNAGKIEGLWLEFEEKSSPESQYANAMDRLQPILSNIYSKTGGTWRLYGVKKQQVLDRIEPIKSFNDEVYDLVIDEINKAVDKGDITLV